MPRLAMNKPLVEAQNTFDWVTLRFGPLDLAFLKFKPGVRRSP
jgi:hypothetical protein